MKELRFVYTINAQIEETHDEKSVGHIDYSLPVAETGYVKLERLRVDIGYRRKGIGKELVSRFVKAVGSGRKVITTPITNEESLKALEDLEPQRGADEAVTVVFKDHEILRTIPLVRLLESGNISVASVTVEYNPRDGLKNPHFLISEAKIRGITR
jgi:hypothetical protein